MIQMNRPLLRPAEKLLPYLKRIDDSRWYTNSGPLVREYEERLESLFGCCVAATSSGTAALTAGLIAQERRNNQVVMPSWTFVATANAVRAAGMTPFFVDVDELTWEGIGADLMVSPFGAPVKTKMALDAAGAFDACMLKQIPVGDAPVCISTHATKCFSTGEGGLVLSRDRDLIKRVKSIINHGITPGRDVPVAGINGKLSEYHAAIGLAEIDDLAWKRGRWLDTKRRYVQAFGDLAHTTPLSSLSWVSPFFAVRLVGRDGDAVRAKLEANGIMSRKIWGDGVHKYEAYKRRDGFYKLPVTKKLAREVVFIPISIDTTDEELEKIVGAVKEAAEQCASQ